MNLKYETIKAAVSGDKKAMDEVLNEYEPYMMFLSIIVRRDKDGHEEKVFSQDAYQMLKLKLIEEIPKWKEINK
jgi:hypothetical protein